MGAKESNDRIRIDDLPEQSLAGDDAAAVKGGQMTSRPPIKIGTPSLGGNPGGTSGSRGDTKKTQTLNDDNEVVYDEPDDATPTPTPTPKAL
jgi:hypothetical protein